MQRAIDIATTKFDAAQAEAGVQIYFAWGYVHILYLVCTSVCVCVYRSAQPCAPVPEASPNTERACTSVARRSFGISFCLGRAHRSLQDVNRDGVNVLYDVNHLGEPRFEQGFAFSPRCQERIHKVCDDLRLYNASDEYLELIKRDDELQGFCPPSRARAHTQTHMHAHIRSLGPHKAESSLSFALSLLPVSLAAVTAGPVGI